MLKTKPAKTSFWAGLWGAVQIVLCLLVLVTVFSLIAAM